MTNGLVFVLPMVFAGMVLAAQAAAQDGGAAPQDVSPPAADAQLAPLMPSAIVIVNQLSAPAAMQISPQERVTLEEFVESPELRHAAPSIDIHAINFDKASPTVRLDQLLKVQQIALALNSLSDSEPEALFLIEGHTDADASDEFSMSLSEQRAEALKAALVRNFGTHEHSVYAVGFGKRDLLDVNVEAAWQNRRMTLRRIDHLVRP